MEVKLSALYGIYDRPDDRPSDRRALREVTHTPVTYK